MSLIDNKRKKGGHGASTTVGTAPIVAAQVPSNRREEILEYLKLFGYKPDRTILQVHIAGFLINGRPTQGSEYKERQLPEDMGARLLWL
jgi:hypothetical protein